MTNLLQEQRLSLSSLAHEQGISPSTVGRWCNRGLRGVRLEIYWHGGRRFTSREAAARFFERVTAAATGKAPATTQRRRSASIEQAERELGEEGL
jgi:hypothetical protein